MVIGLVFLGSTLKHCIGPNFYQLRIHIAQWYYCIDDPPRPKTNNMRFLKTNGLILDILKIMYFYH